MKLLFCVGSSARMFIKTHILPKDPLPSIRNFFLRWKWKVDGHNVLLSMNWLFLSKSHTAHDSPLCTGTKSGRKGSFLLDTFFLLVIWQAIACWRGAHRHSCS